MNDIKWLEDPVCKRMMEEQEAWFSFTTTNELCVFQEYGRVKTDTAYYAGRTWTQTIPLPLHAAWVLARAEEEMRDRLVIELAYELSWKWRIADVKKNEFLPNNSKTGILKCPSRPAAVLAAYDYLYPKAVEEELPNNQADDAAEKKDNLLHRLRSVGSPGGLRDMCQEAATALEEQMGDLMETAEKCACHPEEPTSVVMNIGDKVFVATEKSMDERLGRLEASIEVIWEILYNNLPEGTMYGMTLESRVDYWLAARKGGE